MTVKLRELVVLPFLRSSRRVEEHVVKGVVEIIGDHIAIGGSIGRARRGLILGHGGDVFFFLSRRSFFGREGGKNKEERMYPHLSL
jgi:hypothetical protein